MGLEPQTLHTAHDAMGKVLMTTQQSSTIQGSEAIA
jgi:hypothetical protein